MLSVLCLFLFCLQKFEFPGSAVKAAWAKEENRAGRLCLASSRPVAIPFLGGKIQNSKVKWMPQEKVKTMVKNHYHI